MMMKQVNEQNRNALERCIEAAIASLVAFAAIYVVFSLEAMAAVTT